MPTLTPKMVLMTGEGGKAFCAGGDVKSLYESGIGKAPASVRTEFFQKEYLLDYNFATMTPV